MLRLLQIGWSMRGGTNVVTISVCMYCICDIIQIESETSRAIDALLFGWIVWSITVLVASKAKQYHSLIQDNESCILDSYSIDERGESVLPLSDNVAGLVLQIIKA